MTSKKNIEIARNLHSATIRLLRQLRLVDQKLGISSARLSLLSVLVFKGSCSLSELAEIEQVSKPTITNLVKNLIEEGLVFCTQRAEDKRVVIANPTKKGQRMLEKGQQNRVNKLAELFENLPDEDVNCLSCTADIILTLLNSEHSK